MVAWLRRLGNRIESRAGRNLLIAVPVAIFSGALLLFSLIWVRDLFVFVVMAVGAAAVMELVSALKTGLGFRVNLWMALVSSLFLPAIALYYPPGLWWASAAAIVSVILIQIASLLGRGILFSAKFFEELLAALATFAYVPLMQVALVLVVIGPDGQLWVVCLFVVVVAADTFAYISGVLWGRHKMAPQISPKKTWEGLAGGFVGSVVLGTLFVVWLLGMPWWFGLIFSVGIFFSATIGDLAESWLKRALGIKDMSSWMPGHGGVLDRIDSVLPSALVLLWLSLFAV